MGYFKYIPFERFESLRRGRIRFTQPGAFNDPFEMPTFKAREAEAVRRAGLAGLTAQTGEIQQGLSQGRIPDAAFVPPIYYFMGMVPPRQQQAIPSEQAINKLKKIDQVFGILSLSTTSDNLLLWAHYAGEHRGLAVEIDPGDQEFNSHAARNQNFERAGPVKYSAVRPKIPETDEILFEHFFVKSPEWAYEREYRIVRKFESARETIEAQPFPVHLYELPANAIRRVIFGARVPPDQRGALMRNTAANPPFAHVKFAEAVLDPGQFKVAIRDFALRDLELREHQREAP
jgi:Protein of unknown function (DUF2971)